MVKADRKDPPVKKSPLISSGELERRGRHVGQAPYRCTELAPVARPTGQNQDLDGLRRLSQRKLHAFEAIVIGIDQGIVKDHGGGIALFPKVDREGEPDENRELLPGADTQRRIGFLPAITRDPGDRQGFLIKGEARAGEEQPQERIDGFEDGSEKRLLGVALGALLRLEQELPSGCLSPYPIASSNSLICLLTRLFEQLSDAAFAERR